jgi:ATP-dependent RNA helicase DeaD
VSDEFASLGLRAELAAAAAAAGFDAPTPIQRQSIPVLRRGGNVVLHAGAGSGVTAAFALGLLDRLRGAASEAEEDAEPGPLRPRVLVVTPTEERAAGVARTFARLGGDRDVRALTLAWGVGGTGRVVTGAAGAVARSVRESALKLDGLEAVVLDRLTTMFALEEPALLETILASVPAGAQRVVTLSEATKALERFIEAHVRRALTIPPRVLELEPSAPVAPVGELSYVIATREQKPAALARVLRRPRSEPPVVVTRSVRAAAALREELGLRGFAAGGAGSEVVVRPAAERDGQALIAYDVPVDAATLGAMDLKDGLVLIEPDELAHLRALAAEAHVTLKAVGAGRAARGSVAAFRDAIRRAIREEDLDAQVLLLEPLLEEHDAVEVAAALAALLRSKRLEAEPAAPAEAERGGPEKPQAFVRLFVSAGHRDNIRPGDLVGAITGEASVTGEQVGRIEIRDTFSVVEVASDVADRVIKALNGTTLRGRSLRVDYDRRGAPAPRPPRLSRPAR